MPKLVSKRTTYGKWMPFTTQQEAIEHTNFKAFDSERFPDWVWSYLVDERHLGIKGSAIDAEHRVPAWLIDNKERGYVNFLCWNYYKEHCDGQ